MKISATIVAFNEERNIARAVASLSPCVDEIVVVDSGGSDRTREIAASLGARVIEEPWRGYAAQKNFAASIAAHPYILSIDADEELTPALAAEIAELKTKSPQFDAWTMPRLARYLGRWIRHSGWYPDRKVRLYHRDRAAWQGDYVHESVQLSRGISGAIGHLNSDLLHFTCDSLSQHLSTLDRYTSLAAQQLAAAGKPISFRRLVIDPPWTFLRSYVLQRGFLDGTHGFVIAAMASFYTFTKYAKARATPRETPK
jgi:glycosyltransferase involved in cell wall biosynthesis